VRLDRLRDQPDCRAVLGPLDHQELLAGENPVTANADEIDDDELLAQLGVDAAGRLTSQNSGMSGRLRRSTRPRKSPTPEVRGLRPLSKPLFPSDSEGDRERQSARPAPSSLRPKSGRVAGFIVGGQKAYVAEMGEVFTNAQGRTDAASSRDLRQWHESNMPHALASTGVAQGRRGRRITDPVAGPLFSDQYAEDDHAAARSMCCEVSLTIRWSRRTVT